MDRSRVLCRPGFSICKRHAGLSQKSAKFLVSMENILGKIRSCWMLLKKSQHGDSILAKGMTTHPSTFLPLPLQPAAPHAWSSQLKDGDTETGKGDPLGAISLPCTSPSDVGPFLRQGGKMLENPSQGAHQTLALSGTQPVHLEAQV